LIILTGISWTWRVDIYQGLQYLQGKEEVSPRFYSHAPSWNSALVSLPEIYSKLAKDYPDLSVQGIAPPLRRSDIVSIRLIDKDSLSYTPQHHLSLDAYTLQEKYRVYSWSAQAKDSLYAYSIVQYGLHTGFIFGELGKWLWALVNILLLLTINLGTYLWLKRHKAKKEVKK
jgi:hypothetical protein